MSMPRPHMPQEMFNDDAFAKIKKGARIVNVARGGVIDDAALARALDSGAVAQACPGQSGRWAACLLKTSSQPASGFVS